MASRETDQNGFELEGREQMGFLRQSSRMAGHGTLRRPLDEEQTCSTSRPVFG
jgi:hypothetical protein